MISVSSFLLLLLSFFLLGDKCTSPERSVYVLHLASCDEFSLVRLDLFLEEVYAVCFNCDTTMIFYQAAMLILIQCGPACKFVFSFQL